MRYVIPFDISNNRRRRQVVKILLSFARRVQESVFEGHFTKSQLAECEKRISKEIDPVDSVRFYPICHTCSESIILKGNADPVDEMSLIII